MDLLYPFDEKNSKEEIIVAQVDNVLLNTNYTVLKFLMMQEDKNTVMNLFPYIKNYIPIVDRNRYILSYSQVRKEFLIGLSKGVFTDPISTIEDEIDYLELNTFRPAVNVSLNSILKSDKIKSLTLSSDYWTETKLKKMQDCYHDYIDTKVFVSENENMLDLLNDNKDATLFWLQSIEEFMNTVVYNYDLSNKTFLFPYVMFNMELNGNDDQSSTWLYKDEIEKLCKEHNCTIDFFRPIVIN